MILQMMTAMLHSDELQRTRRIGDKSKDVKHLALQQKTNNEIKLYRNYYTKYCS